MKLVYKGKFESEEQLSEGNLPEQAVKFDEPETLAELTKVASVFIIPVIVLIGAAIYARILLGRDLDIHAMVNGWGFALAFATIIPHELLHAVAFPKDAEAELWYSLKHASAFVFSTYPVSKRRFIFLCLLPNLVFGVVPLLLWALLPIHSSVAGAIFSFAVVSLSMGVGDFLNVYNAARQMPKNSVTQLSGFNSYWYRT